MCISQTSYSLLYKRVYNTVAFLKIVRFKNYCTGTCKSCPNGLYGGVNTRMQKTLTKIISNKTHSTTNAAYHCGAFFWHHQASSGLYAYVTRSFAKNKWGCDLANYVHFTIDYQLKTEQKILDENNKTFETSLWPMK
jgi:hypothetical protein